MQKIIIIGAGPAGLTAAYELLKHSSEFEVHILDDNESAGGLSRTIDYKGNRMDIGGHRFFSKHQDITNWWYHFMPAQGAPAYDDQVLGRTMQFDPNGADPKTQDQVMLTRRRLSRIFYKRKFFDYPIALNQATLKNMGGLQTVKVGISYLICCLYKLPETSLENFYINRFGRVLYSMFFKDYTQKVWGRPVSQISADWGRQRVKGLSIRAVIKDAIFKGRLLGKHQTVETSLIKQFLYPKYGPGQLWEEVAKEIETMGGKLSYNAYVSRIEVGQDVIRGLSYIDQTSGRLHHLSADIVISSIPLKDLVTQMTPQVPKEIMDIAKGLPYRDFITIGLLVDKVKLKNQSQWKTLNNILPDCWIYVQDADVKLGRIQIFNNWSPYLVKEVDSKIWLGLEYFCNEGDEFWSLSEAEAANFAIDELIKLRVIDKKEEVLDYHRERIKKAYPAYFDTYKDIDKLISYLEQFDNLYCIGRNGQHRYNNMDHSMLTAFEAAKHIMGCKKSKKDIWKVNTESYYHEDSKK